MPNFSLINVRKRSFDEKIVAGEWIQNAVGTTLEEATKRAIKYEKSVLSKQIEVAVVAEILSPTPQGMWYNLERLDQSRRFS